MEKLTYYFEKKLFTIDIVYTNNKNMYLKVKGDKVICSAPKRMPKKEIELFISMHAKKFFEYIEKTKRNKLYSLSQNFIYLFGKKYDIQKLIFFGRTKTEIVNNTLYIYTKDINDIAIDKIIKNILKKELNKYISEKQTQIEKEMGIPAHTIKFIYKKTNWGSNVVSKKSISYSTKLAHFSHEVIDYVITHELAHHIEPNHSSAFWGIVKEQVPNYKELKKLLKADESMEG